MIREWMYGDGTIAQYDTNTNLIQFLHPGSRENLVPPHPATQEELDAFNSVYPEASAEEIVAKNAVVSALYSVLLQLRQISADSNVTGDELQSVLPQVTVALEAYRDYEGKPDHTIDKLVNLVLSQALLSIQILVSNAYSGIYNTVVQGQILKVGLEELQDTVAQIQDGHAQHIIDFHS
jgi:hypothetical protein